MPSAINPAYPVAVSPTTQSVRENFAAAKTEIEALAAVITDPLPPNYGLFGPASGPAASPTYRALVPADMPTMTATVAGKVPTPPNNTTDFLRGDGAWAPPAGGAGLTNWTDAIASAAPNATVKVASISATNAATNLDAAIIAKGNGASIANIPDNTATGGNKRGAYATDWQKTRATAAQVASGDSATIGGGYANTAGGTKATVAGGYINTASNSYATVAGGNTNTASGYESTIGGGAINTASGNDSTIGGGNTNTANSTNCTVAGGQSNSSTAPGAAIGGGAGNSASGNYAAVSGGDTNTASGQYSSIGGGQQATTRGIYGMAARASGQTDTLGDAQAGKYILRAKSTDATAKTLTANNVAASTTNQVIMPNNATYQFSARVAARNTANGDSAAFVFSGLIRRGANAASTALVTAVTSTIGPNDAGAAAWTITATADTANGGLKIEATGAAATTIKWTAIVETVEISN